MTERFTCPSTSGRRANWISVIGACLLVYYSQAGAAVDDDTQQNAWNRTFELLQQAQDEAGRSRQYLSQAWAQIQLGLEQTRDDPLQHGHWLHARWLYFLLQDKHLQARDSLEEALACLAQAHADPDLVAKFMSDLSYSLISLGEVAKAKEYLRRAIVLLGQHRNRGLLGDLYYSLGDAYRKTGERMVARRYFEAAYELDTAVGDDSNASASQLKLGSLARDAGSYAEAIQRHERALEQFRGKGEYRELVTEIELARDYAAQGALELAKKYAQDALLDQRALFEQRIDADILLLRIDNDRRRRAARQGADGRSTAGPATGSEGTAADRKYIAQLVSDIESLLDRSSGTQKSKLSQPTRRLQFAEQAIRHYALNRDIGKVTMHGRAAISLARRVASDLRATNDDSLAWLTEAQPVLNEYVKALYELDRSQVYPLLEAYYGQLTDTGALRHSGVIGRAFETQAIGLFERYRTAERSLVDATADLERLQSYEDAAAGIRAAKLQLDQRLRERDLARDAYLAIYQAQPMAPLPQESGTRLTRQVLPASDIVIRYFVQEEVSFGVALAGQDLEYFDLPRRSEVLKLVQLALHSLQTPRSGDARLAALSSLARLLPREFLARHGGATRLVIVPDDAMQLLPFAAINLDGPAQPYLPLVERFETVRTKSASGYYASRTSSNTEKETRTGADIVVFADPILGAPPVGGVQLRKAPVSKWVDRLFRLPSTRNEVASIERTFAARVVRTYLGKDATSDVLLSPAARATKVLHIATHGYFSETTPDIVGLATSGAHATDRSGGGFLGITELFREPFSSRLVVISGCETMRGKDYSGWGVRSLADGFLTQGAGSVIGTLWNVSDIETAMLMDGFYRALHGSNGNSSLALRSAQRELASSRHFSDPYYWAGVVLESSNRSIDQRAL